MSHHSSIAVAKYQHLEYSITQSRPVRSNDKATLRKKLSLLTGKSNGLIKPNCIWINYGHTQYGHNMA
jgi:hypothetical protein